MPNAPDASDDRDLQRIWLATQTLEWRTLALIPAAAGASVVPLAMAISSLGLQIRSESIGVADLRHMSLVHLSSNTNVIRWHVNRGERVIFALSSPRDNVSTIPFARLADCAILCVELGTTGIGEAQRIVSEVGCDRFLGTVVVRPLSTRAHGQDRRAVIPLGA
jgi:hypothetical protein